MLTITPSRTLYQPSHIKQLNQPPIDLSVSIKHFLSCSQNRYRGCHAINQYSSLKLPDGRPWRVRNKRLTTATNSPRPTSRLQQPPCFSAAEGNSGSNDKLLDRRLSCESSDLIFLTPALSNPVPRGSSFAPPQSATMYVSPPLPWCLRYDAGQG